MYTDYLLVGHCLYSERVSFAQLVLLGEGKGAKCLGGRDGAFVDVGIAAEMRSLISSSCFSVGFICFPLFRGEIFAACDVGRNKNGFCL